MFQLRFPLRRSQDEERSSIRDLEGGEEDLKGGRRGVQSQTCFKLLLRGLDEGCRNQKALQIEIDRNRQCGGGQCPKRMQEHGLKTTPDRSKASSDLAFRVRVNVAHLSSFSAGLLCSGFRV